MKVFNYLEYKILLLFEQFPDRISVSILIGFAFLAILFFIYAFLFYKRLVYVLFKPRNKHWSTLITNILTNFLMYADDPDVDDPVAAIMPKIKHLPFKRDFLQQMLYQQVLTYHANFTGNTSDRLKDLFLELGLDKILLKKLQSNKRELVIQGVREVAQLQFIELSLQILKLCESKSLPIRMEAQAAHIILNMEHSFDFLDNMNEPILDWYQLVLIELTSHINPTKLPDFSNWLQSKNPSVVKLCIKLIGRFQQFQAVDQLIKLLKNPDKEIQHLSIKVLGEFEVQEAEEALLQLYVESSKETKAEIIHALGRICSANQLEFLLSNASSDQFKIAFQAVKALKNHGEPGLVRIKKLYTQAPKMNKEIIDHLIGSPMAS